MAAPFIFTGTFGIREGKLTTAKEALAQLARHVEANEPRVHHFGLYFDEEHGRVTVVQVHPDASSMELHLKVIAGHLQDSGDYLDFTDRKSQIFGTPGDALLTQLREFDGDALSVATPLTGFNRIPAT